MLNTILLIIILIFTWFIGYKITQREPIRKDLQAKLNKKEKQEEGEIMKEYYIEQYIKEKEEGKDPYILAIWKDEAEARYKAKHKKEKK